MLCEMGRLGQKTGAGWYRYDKGSRTPIPDPVVEELIMSESKRHGIERKPISDEDIIKRCLYGMVNEGARVLEKSIAQRPSDIDVCYVTGYGFPKWRGGPMYYADMVGLRNVYEEIERLHAKHGYWWEPAPLLKQLTKDGKRFADLQGGSKKVAAK